MSSSGQSPAPAVVWTKGHGTRNDFVLLDDPDGSLFGDLDPVLVRRLCDRRAGVGADGVLRVIRSTALADAAVQAGELPEWFMDYRNADGSVAEMCGNGVRVFAQYLLATGRAAPGSPVAIGTRDGVRTARPVPWPGPDDAAAGVPEQPAAGVPEQPASGVPEQPATRTPEDPSAGWWSVDMGVVDLARYRCAPLSVAVDDAGHPLLPAVGADVGNPHAVVLVDDLAEAGSLTHPPQVTPPGVYPDGVNVEFVQRTGPTSFAMRVHERGAGETESCGTGICAAAAVLHASTGDPAAAAAGDSGPDAASSAAAAGDPGPVKAPGGPGAPTTYDVRVPGGRLTAAVTPLGPDRFDVVLAGPAVLVGEGRLAR